MTPERQKAEELVNEFDLMQTYVEGFGYDNAIQCAIICVKNEINLFRDVILNFHLDENLLALEKYRELKKVLNELENM